MYTVIKFRSRIQVPIVTAHGSTSLQKGVRFADYPNVEKS